jgi:hypothetical protein
MKTTKRFFSNMMLISFIVVAGAITFSSCNKNDKNTNNNRVYTVSGNASGTQMVPSVSGSGTATINGTYDANTRLLTYTTNWTNLSGGPTSASFYTGASGSAGVAVGSPWSLGAGLSGTGTFSSTITLTDQQAMDLINGLWFYTLATTANSSGEVRGQITATAQ